MTSNPIYGAVESGGTKFVCVVGSKPDKIIEQVRFPTTTPDESITRAVAFFRKFKPAAIGLACFGPLDLDPASADYGSITTTPKSGWAGTNMLSIFKRKFHIPVVIDLDVNAAAFGEHFWIPENKKLNSLVYFTIGTGINAGVLLNGKVIPGLSHPETGHMRLPHDRKKDPFPGICPFHGDCFEGMASGPALARRWRQPAEKLPDNHPAWDLEATYIAYAVVNMTLTLSPQRIILGGGVMEHHQLFPSIRRKVHDLLNGYINSPVLGGTMENYIVPTALGKNSGVLGALALAKRTR